MPKVKTLKNTLINRLKIGLLLPVVLSASFSALAEGTVVKIAKSYENHTVNEGHRADIDTMLKARELAQATATAQDLPKGPVIEAPTARHSWWEYDGIYFADTETRLYHDNDRNGFYTGFSLYFDVDSEYGSRWVYARIYLKSGQSDYRFFHETHVFEIYENEWYDGYEVEADLLANYEADYYDIRIELYETGDSQPWDTIDASTHSNLRGLPLESERYNDGPRDEHIHEYSGSVTWVLPTLLLFGLIFRRRRAA